MAERLKVAELGHRAAQTLDSGRRAGVSLRAQRRGGGDEEEEEEEVGVVKREKRDTRLNMRATPNQAGPLTAFALPSIQQRARAAGRRRPRSGWQGGSDQ